jgi:hypothetical protein
MLFNSITYSSLSKLISEQTFLSDWEKAKTGKYPTKIPKEYYTKWPLQWETEGIPPVLNNNADNNNNN